MQIISKDRQPIITAIPLPPLNLTKLEINGQEK